MEIAIRYVNSVFVSMPGARLFAVVLPCALARRMVPFEIAW